MNPVTNSRRNFLGIMAILTSGTVVAGSPLCLLNDKKSSAALLKKDWETFLAAGEARSVIPMHTLQTGIEAMNGQRFEAGEAMYLPQQNMLAQPTWIYWGNNNKPSDVIVSFFENSGDHKKIKNINRFELAALAKLGATHADKDLLQHICTKKAQDKKPALNILTKIKKDQQLQNVVLYKNNTVVFKEQLFYNV